MNRKIQKLIWILNIIFAYYGLRFVTQAGQGLGVVQNDGYGATGGFMLLGSGIIFGWLLTTQGNSKKK